MTSEAEDPDERGGMLRLSHRLVALHIGGVALLILVVLGSVLWISAKHNELAAKSSARLVRGGLTAFRVKVETLVYDYSVWDEAYQALKQDDRTWLYSNIGTAATDIGTLDLIVFVRPETGQEFGWQVGSPPAGESGLLPAETLAAVLGLVAGAEPADGAKRSFFALLDGEPWALSAAQVRPLAGVSDGTPSDRLPRQIHGLRISPERLSELSESLLTDGLHLAGAEGEGPVSVKLRDHLGNPIASVAWDPPQPGASILRQVAIPLALALAVASMISAVSSRYAVRSARRLEQALLAAKAADRSKTEFLSNVSHELRTPMNGILGAAQLLEMTKLDDEQRELVAVLHASGNAQMALISDLIDWTQLEGGDRRLASEPFQPAAVLKELTEMMRVAAGKKKIAFEADFRALAGVTLLGDGRAFRQIVTNLLSNAVKFTDRGRVELQARLAQGADTAEVVVEVRDTGRGIPEAALARIFDRFYQVDGSWTRGNEGTGLGLAISQRLSELMGGRIEVASEVGVGSTFAYRVSLAVARRSGDALDAA